MSKKYSKWGHLGRNVEDGKFHTFWCIDNNHTGAKGCSCSRYDSDLETEEEVKQRIERELEHLKAEAIYQAELEKLNQPCWTVLASFLVAGAIVAILYIYEIFK